MLRNFVIFSIYIVAIQAAGKFSILSAPKSISFKGEDNLESEFIADVLLAATGNSIPSNAGWGGLIIEDPFNTPRNVLAVVVEGKNQFNFNGAKSYTVKGNSVQQSLNSLDNYLQSADQSACDINFNQYDEGVEDFRSCFGNYDLRSEISTEYLNPSQHTSDKEFLQSISNLNKAADEVYIANKDYIIVRLSLESIIKAHGEQSGAVQEASKLLSNTIRKLTTAVEKAHPKEALVVAITNVERVERRKREVIQADSTNKYNLATYYSQDYPVIFNIILWFMVTFGFALLAICYAIGEMDPGRDSIIYRMTSTRMKKDN